MASYPVKYAPRHPRANGKGCVCAHIIVAEAALGRPLPATAQVHHVNENRYDYSKGNLVICEDAAYHKLLHVRARIVRAGGDPDGDRFCSVCGEMKPLTAFNRAAGNKATGLQTSCRQCQSAYYKTYKRPAA